MFGLFLFNPSPEGYFEASALSLWVSPLPKASTVLMEPIPIQSFEGF